jgi:hypothetical protein
MIIILKVCEVLIYYAVKITIYALFSDKSLPKLITTTTSQHSSVTTMIMHQQRSRRPSSFSYNKPLPSIIQSKNKNIGFYRISCDSAVDLLTTLQEKDTSSTITLPPLYQDKKKAQHHPNSISVKPLPSINYNPIRNIGIIHIKKVNCSSIEVVNTKKLTNIFLFRNTMD